jgi:hypothetical protein
MAEIDMDPQPAVKSLRSKFEQLANDLANKRPMMVQDSMLEPDSAVARPRAVSGSSSDNPHPDTRDLRPSSSSSDLKQSIKRPPPPPPRPSKAGQRPASPLLRPVPVPAVLVAIPDGSPSNLPPKRQYPASIHSVHEGVDASHFLSDNVASLRNKFS